MIRKRVNEKGMEFLDVRTDQCTAMVCLHGAQVLSWTPAGQRECLFAPQGNSWQPGSPIRGGVPVCWPWFGKKKDGPTHGIGRISNWEIDHHGVCPDDGVASIHLRLYSEDDHLPAAFMRITLGSELRMRLQTTCRKSQCELTAAFHNYFLVNDITRCRVHGLSNTPYREHGLSHRVRQRPFAPLPLNEPMDRIYSSSVPITSVTLEDPEWGRSISIASENTRDIVVWQPGEDGAAQLPELSPSDWKRFVCLEPAITSSRPVKLSPGQTHIMRQTIKIAPLA